MFDFVKKENKPLERIVQRRMESEIKMNSGDLGQSNERGVIQAKRKVVSKENNSIENAILWDKKQHKFFKNMRPYEDSGEPNDLIHKIKTGDIENEESEAKGKFHDGIYLDNSEKDKVGLNEVLLEYDETHFVETNKREDMQVYNAGEQVPEAEEPFAIRLYAEGNMDHALGLAEGMERYLGQEGEHSNDIFPFDKMSGKKVLIKATEFRRLSEVEEAYRSEGREAFQGREMGERFHNWEGSFGGSTGDMTKKVGEGEHRKYDLIQTTFFWIQGYKRNEIKTAKKDKGETNERLNQEIRQLAMQMKKCSNDESGMKERESIRIRMEEINALVETNKEEFERFCRSIYDEGNELSYRMMITFVKEQLKKLKPIGEIRIVVSNINPYAQIKGKLEIEIARLKDSEESEFYSNIEIQTIELNKTYPKQLQEESLNEVGFEQRQTQKMSTVTGKTNGETIEKDLIIIISRNGRG